MIDSVRKQVLILILIVQTFGSNPETSSPSGPKSFWIVDVGCCFSICPLSALENQNHPVMLPSPGHSLVQHPTLNTQNPKPHTLNLEPANQVIMFLADTSQASMVLPPMTNFHRKLTYEELTSTFR